MLRNTATIGSWGGAVMLHGWSAEYIDAGTSAEASSQFV